MVDFGKTFLYICVDQKDFSLIPNTNIDLSDRMRQDGYTETNNVCVLYVNVTKPAPMHFKDSKILAHVVLGYSKFGRWWKIYWRWNCSC